MLLSILELHKKGILNNKPLIFIYDPRITVVESEIDTCLTSIFFKKKEEKEICHKLIHTFQGSFTCEKDFQNFNLLMSKLENERHFTIHNRLFHLHSTAENISIGKYVCIYI